MKPSELLQQHRAELLAISQQFVVKTCVYSVQLPKV